MKKLTVLALVATVLMAAPMFGVQRGNLVTAPNATFAAGSPASTDNGSSCDIGVTPAATLLLPYFEVETAGARGSGPTTLFTITNTSRFPQIAHVTLWTDWSYPVLDFNIFLTGYDVQPIDLYDVIVRGIVAPGNTPAGTSSTTTPGSVSTTNPTNPTSQATPAANSANPNIQNTAIASAAGAGGATGLCAGLPGTLPTDITPAVLSVLTTGKTSSSTLLCPGVFVGGAHGSKAIGYLTVDVNANCNTFLPTDPTYYSSVNGLLYDNVLIGDFQQIAPSPAGSSGTGFDAGGNPMVHIRAIPEGGNAGTFVATNLPFTFYNRYSSDPGNVLGANSDRRQPLPSTFAARFIQGAGLSTDYKVWREGVTGAAATCAAYAGNSALLLTDAVRFDEHENATGLAPSLCRTSPCPGTSPNSLPEASRTSTSASTFPPFNSTTDFGGWMYLNLTNGGTGGAGPLTASRAGFGPALNNRTTTQNWVVISMFGNLSSSRVSVDFDSAWLGNGCTPSPAVGAIVGPASQVVGVGANGTQANAGRLICPTGVVCTVATGATPQQPPLVNP